MSTRAFRLSVLVPVEPHTAVDFLADLEHHRGLHPFLVSARVMARGADVDGAWCDWQVVERPAWGPLRYRIRFPARLVRRDPVTLLTLVRAAPGCLLSSTTRAVEVGPELTRLEESTVVTAPRPLIGYMARQAEIAHAQAFERLPAAIAR